MLPFVGTLKSQANRMRGLLSVSSRRMTSLVYCHSGRIAVNNDGQVTKYRVTILVLAESCVEAERVAELHWQSLLQEDAAPFRRDTAIRWLKGRPISWRPQNDESPTVIELLSKLGRDTGNVVSTIERINAPTTPPPERTSTTH